MSRSLGLYLFILMLAIPAYSLVYAGPLVPGGTIPDQSTAYLPLIMNPAPVAAATNTPSPTATSIPSTATQTPIPATATPQATYICDHDEYNCADFATQPQAQAVFDYCFSRGFGDVHGLDQNNDGVACESLPPGFKVLR